MKEYSLWAIALLLLFAAGCATTQNTEEDELEWGSCCDAIPAANISK